jgi:hypothetical protein
MKVLKFVPPYSLDGKNKTRFPERGKTGVYLIKENGKIVYIGYSQYDLYKTMYRHFQQWNHTGQEVVSYNAQGNDNYTVRIVYCTPDQASRLEKYLISKHKPRDNAQTYELDFRDKKTGEAYENSEPQTPKFTAAQLKVMEEDKEYFEEIKSGGEAMFGIGAVESNRKFQIKVINSENKTIGIFFPILDTLPNAINTYKQVFEKYSREKTITLEAIEKI